MTTNRPFDTVLVANRGEIACRVMRTARRLGLRTVAVHSVPDASAPHVREADEAVALGGYGAAESYLRIEAIVEAALRTGAGAIHPGYGFLSENPALVDACVAADIVFVGPGAAAMRAMGLKDAAKRRMEAAGVPVVPGYHDADQDDAVLAAAADTIGYPVLIKARAGGGGKGMRRVETPGAFLEALASARREAAASFGDEAVLVEKWIVAPRHVEVQVFGDTHGRVVHLYERDCSLQRRHQKVIEEAPAPGMTAAVRTAMTAAAVRAAEAIGYVGAGTVEFIADGSDGLRPDGFWFMEMNTRLQVEHPVTEAVTGVDLVEWQLRVAAGEPLPLAQEAIGLAGHAVEARLYAEDPAAGFLPATGRLERLEFARGGRVDSGVREGDVVTPHYDPMLAKLIAHGDDRASAFGTLARQLAGTLVLGTVTNREFLLALCRHPDVLAARLDTGLIERALDALVAPPASRECREARAILAVLRAVSPPLDDAGAGPSPSVGASGPSLAARLGPWRAWGGFERRVAFGLPPEEIHTLTVRQGAAWNDAERDAVRDPGRHAAGPDGRRAVSGEPCWSVEDAEGVLEVTLEPRSVARGGASAVVDGRRRELDVLAFEEGAGRAEARWGERVHRFRWSLPGADATDAAGDGAIVAPMPGRVVDVGCGVGDAVVAGQTLVTLEAMKMEHALLAPLDGIVERLGVAAGDQVAQGEELLRLAEP